ncbi:MAG: trypsin-like serine protease [Myxococcales bacterium]
MRPVALLRACATAVALFFGCSSAERGTTDCPSAVKSALINASPSERFLGLGSDQLRAIVQVISRDDPEGPLCSGTLVAAGWVATARHCVLQILSPEIILPGRAGSAGLRAPVVSGVPHASLDIALLKVGFSETAGVTGVAPIAPAAPEATELSNGDVVEPAGYGLTENGTARDLEFLVEPIIRFDETDLVVSGVGTSGACDGDSGGRCSDETREVRPSSWACCRAARRRAGMRIDMFVSTPFERGSNQSPEHTPPLR